MEIVNFFAECFYEFIFYIFVNQNVIRSYAGLAAIEGLAPGNPSGCKPDVGAFVNDARTFASEFKDDRGEMTSSGTHDFLAKGRTSCEEDKVPSEVQ